MHNALLDRRPGGAVAARGGSWRQDGHGSTGGFTGIVGRPGGASAFNGSPVLHPHHHSEKYYRLTNSVAAEKAGVEPRARLASIGSVASVATALDYVGTQGGAPRQAGIRSSIITLMNATVGASMLVLPFVCGEMGVVVFVVLAIIVAFLSSQSLQLLTKCVQVTEQSCYQGVGREAYGWWGATGTSLIIILQLTGCMIAYLVVVGSMLNLATEALPGVAGSTALWQIATSALVVLPLCMLRRMHYLRFSATLAIGLLALFVIASFVDGVHQVATWPERTVAAGEPIKWVGSVTSILAGVPVVACAYACHQNLFPIIEEIKRPTIGRLRRVANGTMFGIMVIYLLCAMSGYLTFLQGTNGDLLLNYARTPTFVPQVLLRIVGYGIGVALLASLPVICFELRHSLDVMAFGDLDFSKFIHRVPGRPILVVQIVTTTVAILVPGVEVVFAFLGATCSCMIVFCLPGLFYIKLVPPSSDSRCTRATAWTLFVGGLVLCPLSVTVITLQKLGKLG